MENRWIKYVSRSYQQIKDDLLARMVSEIPEMTDHNESNLFVKMLSIWAAITEMLSYYLDNEAREGHLVTSRIYGNMVRHAFAKDYRIHSKIAASVNLRFRLNKEHTSDFVIPIGTEVRTESGVIFRTTESGVIPTGSTEIYITASEGVPVTNVVIGVSNGLYNQVFEIEDDSISDRSLVLRVGSSNWEKRETLAYSFDNDLHFVQTVSTNKKAQVVFGGYFNGALPPVGENIEIDYISTIGELGNVSANSLVITQLAPPTGIELSVTNPNRASGGSDFETIEEMRYRIPRASRTLRRAVTEQDFIDITEGYAGVVKAGVSHSCGEPIEVLIVPNGGGLASDLLIDEVTDYIDDRRIIGQSVVVRPAGEIRIIFGIELNVRPQFDRLEVSDRVKENLVAFGASTNQKINGSVELGDIYQVIETTEGVINSRVLIMSPVPYARALNSTTTPLVWNRSIKNTSNDTVSWRLQMITDTEFQVFRNNSFLGVKNVGENISTNELTFTIESGAYQAGDEWSFQTYKFFGSLILNEPSIPTILGTDVIITTNGGI